MNTATIQPSTSLERPVPHVRVSGRYTWVCAQSHCDGVHHYWRRPL